jgi:hypothetical protein
MFAPKQDPLLPIYLHPQVCVPSQKIRSQFLHQIFCLTIFHLTGNTIRACQSLEHHIMALELDMDVFTKVLEPLVEVATPELDAKHVHSFYIVSLVKKHSRTLLDYE